MIGLGGICKCCRIGSDVCLLPRNVARACLYCRRSTMVACHRKYHPAPPLVPPPPPVRAKTEPQLRHALLQPVCLYSGRHPQADYRWGDRMLRSAEHIDIRLQSPLANWPASVETPYGDAPAIRTAIVRAAMAIEVRLNERYIAWRHSTLWATTVLSQEPKAQHYKPGQRRGNKHAGQSAH